MGLYDGYLYSRDGKLIPVDDTHHEFITENPRYIFSPKEIEHLCDVYKVSSLEGLSDTEEFQFEDGPIYNHLLKSILKKGWLKIRNNQPSHTTYIVCYNYKRDYDTIMNFIENCPDLVEVNIHIEAFDDKDYLTTDKKSVANDLFKMFESNESFFEWLLEAVEDFPKNTRAMYRFARRRHNDTGAVRKVSGQPYWVHPEGVAKIVMEHGGSDVEIKAAFAHDVLEDTGESYEDMEEKFGEKVASIVKEVTNDKFEIARIGKERYISEELCRLSPEALTVKLADMLYNMKDSPTEKNYERMRRNIAFLMMNRQLDGIHLELAEEIMEV